MATDYPAGVYDLYMQYLNEMDQEGIASDAASYIPQLPYTYQGGEGALQDRDDVDPFNYLPKEYDTEDFEALALKDEKDKIKHSLSDVFGDEYQALMDRITGKRGLNIRTDYPLLMGGPTGIFGAWYNRRRDAKRAQKELASLVKGRELEKAQEGQKAADDARVARAYIEETKGEAGSYAPGGGSGAHAADVSGSTYTDPFDPGGGEKHGGLIRKAQGGRVGFTHGNVVDLNKMRLFKIVGDQYDNFASFSKIYDLHGAERMWEGVSTIEIDETYVDKAQGGLVSLLN